MYELVVFLFFQRQLVEGVKFSIGVEFFDVLVQVRILEDILDKKLIKLKILFYYD